MSNNIPPQQLHIPVLLNQVVEQLAPQPGESYLDLTAGYGGHARAILGYTKAPEKAVLVDRDQMAIDALEPFASSGAQVIHDSYADYAQKASEAGKRFDMILVDLGVSSPQLDKANRGFSLKRDGPLDMRMDQRQQRTAADIVNRASKTELIELLELYGEEPKKQALRIADAIIQARPVTTTKQLATVILNTHRGAYQKTHPATRTFQAIRIVLNDELGQLKQLLKLVPTLLNPGGRIAIISFHSLEDRLVKRFFAEQAEAGYEASLGLLTKKAVRGKLEDDTNPRARSASLRAAVKK
jgi:16S rRNA (cytosine1402-N4)-methyltransferase